MPKFTDTINIRIKAGHGGPGAVAFHREKFVPFGGPDGGDGGKGGDIYFMADRRYYNLSHYFKDRIYKAANGEQGKGSNMHGKDGEDLVMKFPLGTQVTDAETGEIMWDLVEEDKPVLVATGGIGGKGNNFFRSSTHQAPRFAQPGLPGEEKSVNLNLKLIADVGLVGLPNSGKSTLLSKLTNARPKIADYPFTTLIPNLGVVERSDSTVYTIADIPGIIEGAHKGHGLGLSFLQHIERVKVILYLIDVSEQDPVYNFTLLQSELDTYNPGLTKKPHYVLITKTDTALDEEVAEKAALFKEDVLPISSISGQNLDRLLKILDELVG